jgi:hypothetical protein
MEGRMRYKYFGFFLCLCFFFTSGAFAEDGPRVEMFSPQGTVKGVRQVAARFSDQMVPFGDPRGLIEPFAIDCPEKGASRWADGKNWVYDFDKDLRAGIRCEFRTKPGLKSLSGKEMSAPKVFSFSTGGPSIMKPSHPYEGNQNVDEEQIFILTLDGEPDQASVIQNVFFSVAGIQDHIGVKLIEGKEREEVLKARYRYGKPPQLPILLIQCKQRFPSNTRVSLVWGKGVKSKTGVETDQDQILHFQTRKAFSVEFHCERENVRAGCIPILPMSLNFSAPISKELANQILLRGQDGKILKPQPENEKESKFIRQVSFKAPFPESTNFSVELPTGLKDDAGRPLVNADKFPLSVRTEKYPPLAKFSARFGVLERKAEPMLPVALRNLEPEVKARMKKVDQEEGIIGRVTGKILNLPPDKATNLQVWLRKVASASRENSLLSQEKGVKDFKVPKPLGDRAFEVVGIPLKDPGLYIVELESTILGSSLLGSQMPMYVPTAVLVTNLSVHFKQGRESSLVWVTTLDTGQPVKDASITVQDCQEKVLWKGKTDSNGIARIEGSMLSARELPRCEYKMDGYDYPQLGALSSLGGGLFITAQTPEDMAFVHSSWDNGIEPWRFQLPEWSYKGPYIAHTIFDRTLFRAGETVHMKHIFREHTTKGFLVPPKERMPSFALVYHYGSEERYEFPVPWDANGIAEMEWVIPKEAKLGTYGVSLSEKSIKKEQYFYEGDRGVWISGGFRVEEFRIPLLKGMIQPPTEPLINAKEVALDLNVQYLAGGGAGLLPVKLRSEIRPKTISSFEGFDQFVFGNGPVQEGLVRRGEPLDLEEEERETEDEVSTEERQGKRKEVKLPSRELVLAVPRSQIYQKLKFQKRY